MSVGHKDGSQVHRVVKDWLPGLPLTVAATIAPASRLTAVVQLDDGFPLEPGVAATDREPTSVATPKVARLRAGSQDDGYVVACTRTAIITKTYWGV